MRKVTNGEVGNFLPLNELRKVDCTPVSLESSGEFWNSSMNHGERWLIDLQNSAVDIAFFQLTITGVSCVIYSSRRISNWMQSAPNYLPPTPLDLNANELEGTLKWLFRMLWLRFAFAIKWHLTTIFRLKFGGSKSFRERSLLKTPDLAGWRLEFLILRID